MKKSIFTKNSKKLSKKQCEDWQKTVLAFAKKMWLITFGIAMFLFLFFQPNEECSRELYFYLFIVRPAVAEGVLILVFWWIFGQLAKKRDLRLMSLFTILESSLFTGIIACVYTSVSFIPVVLLVPMLLIPLYHDKKLTILQLLISLVIYIADIAYFMPNSVYMPPGGTLVDVSIFFGSAIVVFIIIEQVNMNFNLQDERGTRDSLTHLYNHETFYEELEYHIMKYEKSQKKKEPFSVLVADIDNFKKVNDTYGHAFGDEVIRQVAAAIERSRDKNDFCARYGGEEFAVILPGKKMEEACEVGERIRKEFENCQFDTEFGKCHFTLSIGVAEYTTGYKRASQFFGEADKALYMAKKNGKNRVCYAGQKIEPM